MLDQFLWGHSSRVCDITYCKLYYLNIIKVLGQCQIFFKLYFSTDCNIVENQVVNEPHTVFILVLPFIFSHALYIVKKHFLCKCIELGSIIELEPLVSTPTLKKQIAISFADIAFFILSS